MRSLSPDDPRTIGPYTLLGVLGEGGMGKVFIARSEAGKPVAVKVIRNLDGGPGARERFAREVGLAIKVRGSYTANVIEADPQAELPWLAVEYIPGISLAQAVEAAGALPQEAVRVLAAGLAEALQSVHAAGILHRDLKPGNVLLTLDQGPRVIDFGIARALDIQAGTAHTPLTPTGHVMGTPGFIAPEQLRGEELTVQCDIFALGGVLYVAVTGRPPFGRGPTAALHHRILTQDPDVDALTSYRALILQCLDKDPDRRPPLAQIQQRVGALSIGENASLLPPTAKRKVEEERRTLHSLDREAGSTATQPPGPTRQYTSDEEHNAGRAGAKKQEPKDRSEDPEPGTDRTGGYAPAVPPILLKIVIAVVLAYTVIGWAALGVTTWAGTRFPAAAELDIPDLVSLAAVPYSVQLGLIIVHCGLAIGVGIYAIREFSETGFDGFLFGTVLALLVVAGLVVLILDALSFPAAVWIADLFTSAFAADPDP